MTTNNAALATNIGLPKDMSIEATQARIAAVCKEFDLPFPKLKVRKGKAYLTDDLLAWFKESGMSMDWILFGTIMPMVRVFRKNFLVEQEFVSAIRGFDKEEADMLTEALGAFHEKVKARRNDLHA